jgi:hypothetical protein
VSTAADVRRAIAPRANRRRWSAHGRAGVIWGLGCFLAIQGITAVLIDQRYPQIRDPEYGHRLTALKRRLAAEPERPLLLVLGSSRPENGLRPDAMEMGPLLDGRRPLVFNFALSGSGPFEELFCLRCLLAEGVRLRWLLVELLPLSLAEDTPQVLSASRLSYRDLNRRAAFAAGADGLRRDWWSAAFVPWSTHRLSLLSHWAPRALPWSARLNSYWRDCDESGWMRCPVEESDVERREREEARAHQQYEGKFTDYRVSPLTKSSLDRIGQLCAAHEIRPLFYLMPEADSFRCLYPAQTLKIIDDFVALLRQEPGITVIDARRWLPEERFYLDGHHLLEPGATAFSERFGREVLRPFVLKGSLPLAAPRQLTASPAAAAPLGVESGE